MKIGSLVYATDQGLGILAKSFADHRIVTDVAVIAHGSHLNHWEWYPSCLRVDNVRDATLRVALKAFCASMDAMLFFETPYLWDLIDHCRSVGVKTILMPMHECTHQNVYRFRPDLMLCPSALEEQVFRKDFPCVSLPVPVEVPWRKRTRAEVFVHNAGHGGLRGRNGTLELCAAIPYYVKSPAKFIIRNQTGIRGDPSFASAAEDRRVDWIHGTVPYEQLWTEGDVFVFPERFNGLSLPLQEARAAGMLVMATDRFPINTWLPREPLVRPCDSMPARIGPPYIEFQESQIRPEYIAAKIDEWYGRDISAYSEQGREWAELMSWDRLKPEYERVLHELVGK